MPAQAANDLSERMLNETVSRRSPIYHPLLIAAYPVIALLAYNIEEIKVAVALRALALSLLAGALLYAILRALLKDREKAALLTSLTLILFFSYGHVYNYLKQLSLDGGFGLGRHRILAPIWFGAFVLIILWIKRTSNSLQTWNRLFNLVAIVALSLPIARIGLFFGRVLTVSSEPPTQVSISDIRLPPNKPAPDVYYIILDAYTRDDTLKAEFDLDTTPFLRQLETMGFYVVRCAHSNYAQTQLSLSSSLNMNYLQDLDPDYSPEQKTRVGMEELIRHSAVRKAFESLGYQIVAFETGFKGTQLEDADLYLSPSSDVFHSMQIAGGPNGFEVMLLRTSAGLLLADSVNVLPKFLQPDFDNPRKIHRDLILYDFEQLSALPARPGPKFVFAHLVIPHPPYVFGPDGGFTDVDKDYVPGYRDQVIYLNKRLLDLLPKMIAESPTSPVIILQGDHGSIGSKPNTRMTIFNAYYFPDGGAQALHDDISPVNTFRLLFNQYFRGDYDILEDVSYYSVYTAPFNFTVIPNKRAGCQS